MSVIIRDEGEPYVLARFRADPSRVRVGVRRDGDAWLVTVQARSGLGKPVHIRHKRVKAALWRALRIAQERPRPIKGVDLSMGWTYEHPQGLAGHRPE